MNLGLGETTAIAEVQTSIDVAAERARTSGSTSRHFFNAAGAALPSDAIVDTVVEHLREEQAIGGYAAATIAHDRLEKVYADAATLLGARPQEIALFDSATTGLRAVFDALRLGAGDTVIAPRSSYVSQALRMLSLRKEDRVRLVVIPNDATGGMDLDALEDALKEAGPGAVISGVHIPTSSGLVEPVAEIGALSRRYGGRYVLDATQSVGHVAIDVDAIDCDVLVSTGRKFLRGPRGTGFAYVRSGFLDDLALWAPDVRGSQWIGADEWTVGDGARRLESWEYSVAGRLGLGVAFAEAIARGMDATEEHLVGLGARLRTELAAIDGVTVVDPAASPSAIVTFVLDQLPSKSVSAALTAAGIDTIAIPASHAQWDLGERGIPSVVRASPHVYNDANDLDALIGTVAELAATASREVAV